MAKWIVNWGQGNSFVAEITDDTPLTSIAQMIVEHGGVGAADIYGELSLQPESDGRFLLTDDSGAPYAYLTRYTAPTFGSAVAQAETSAASRPRCPTCGSTDITRQGIVGRAVTSTLIGGFAPESRAQFRCNKCGYMW